MAAPLTPSLNGTAVKKKNLPLLNTLFTSLPHPPIFSTLWYCIVYHDISVLKYSKVVDKSGTDPKSLPGSGLGILAKILIEKQQKINSTK